MPKLRPMRPTWSIGKNLSVTVLPEGGLSIFFDDDIMACKTYLDNRQARRFYKKLKELYE